MLMGYSFAYGIGKRLLKEHRSEDFPKVEKKGVIGAPLTNYLWGFAEDFRT